MLNCASPVSNCASLGGKNKEPCMLLLSFRSFEREIICIINHINIGIIYKLAGEHPHWGSEYMLIRTFLELQIYPSVCLFISGQSLYIFNDNICKSTMKGRGGGHSEQCLNRPKLVLIAHKYHDNKSLRMI